LVYFLSSLLKMHGPKHKTKKQQIMVSHLLTIIRCVLDGIYTSEI